MYTIKNLNNLYKNIIGFFKGESYIQEGVEFSLELKQTHKCYFKEIDDSVVFFINASQVYSISYDDLEPGKEEQTVENFWHFLLEQFSYKENIPGLLLKNIYSGQHVIFTPENTLIQIQYTEYLSEKTGKPFLFLNRITKLENIVKNEICDNKLFLENLNNNKIEKFEFFLI